MASAEAIALLKRLLHPVEQPLPDPRLTVAALETQVTIVPLVANVDQMIAPQNNRRVAIGFLWDDGFLAAPYYGPINPDVAIGWSTMSGPPSDWYRMEDYPGIVQEKWWANPGAFTSVILIEILRK